MILSQNPQGTPGWFDDRAGVPTASAFSRIITTKGEPSKSAGEYMQELTYEAIYGANEGKYSNQAMQRGHVEEPKARALYSYMTDYEVEEVGLCWKDERRDRAASADGDIPSEKKGLEIKCPEWKEFFATIKAGVLPTKHFCQVHGSMYVYGYGAWDFMSFYDGVSPLIITVELDYVWASKLDRLLNEFNEELATIIQKLRS